MKSKLLLCAIFAISMQATYLISMDSSAEQTLREQLPSPAKGYKDILRYTESAITNSGFSVSKTKAQNGAVQFPVDNFKPSLKNSRTKDKITRLNKELREKFVASNK